MNILIISAVIIIPIICISIWCCIAARWANRMNREQGNVDAPIYKECICC